MESVIYHAFNCYFFCPNEVLLSVKKATLRCGFNDFFVRFEKS